MVGKSVIRNLQRMIRSAITRAVVDAVNDAGGLQVVKVQGMHGAINDEVERFQQYGLTSRPLAGAEALVLRVGGSSDHVVCIAVDDRANRDGGLVAGEVRLYDDQGQRVTLYRAKIEIEGTTTVIDASSSHTVDAPSVTLGAAVLLPTDGVLTGLAVDPFTKLTHFALGNASTVVKAKKT